MVKMKPLKPPLPLTKFEFLENLNEIRSDHNLTWFDNEIWDDIITLADLETTSYLLQWFEEFQSEELRKRTFLSILEEYFNDDWRLGQEVHKVIITQRLYQTSPNSTQA